MCHRRRATVCEDGSGVDYLVGVTPMGEIYKFGRNAMNGGEFAGATFSLARMNQSNELTAMLASGVNWVRG